MLDNTKENAVCASNGFTNVMRHQSISYLWKVPSAATGLEFECFFLSLVMKMSSNLALTLMPLHNKSRENRVMSYQTFLTSGQDATWLLFRLGQIWEKWWNMTPRHLFVLLNCYISQHTLRVIFCLSLTLHFELIKASISMTWCHHSLSLIFHHGWIPESWFA